jgi:hypothetical protein
MDQDSVDPRASDFGYVAFADQTCIASGDLAAVASEAKRTLDADGRPRVLILDAVTSEPVELDLRGTLDEAIARISPFPVKSTSERRATPGRPKLGVVAREITLLPRHWEWLSEQPGGASVTLRKLVEEARRSTAGESAVRRAREACYRFMTIMAGDEPNYEDALRALFAGERERFDLLTQQWPVDVRAHARRLAAGSVLDGSAR